MSQLRRGIIICFLLVAVSTLEVDRHSVLQLESLSLDKVGSKTLPSHAEQPPHGSPNGGDRLLFQHFLSKHLATSMVLQHAGNSTFVFTILFIIAVFLLGMWGGHLATDSRDEPSEAARDKYMPTLIETCTNKIPESGEGSWACRYRMSNDEDKEALSLLLSCGIVAKPEFANSEVSQEHIAECLWVAKTMLEAMPLKEWVALSEHGSKQAFEDSVAAVFEANSGSSRVHQIFSNPDTQGARSVDGNYSEASFENDLPKASLRTVFGRESREYHVLQAGTMPPPSSPLLETPPQFGTPRPHEQQVGAAALPSDLSLAPPSSYFGSLLPSPVPTVNCYDQARADGSFTTTPMPYHKSGQIDEVASSVGSTHLDEDVFPSIFSSATGSPQTSENSSPQESQKAPPSSTFSSASSLPSRAPVKLQCRVVTSPLLDVQAQSRDLRYAALPDAVSSRLAASSAQSSPSLPDSLPPFRGSPFMSLQSGGRHAAS